MTTRSPIDVYCNGASQDAPTDASLTLEYDQVVGSVPPNVKIGLPAFVRTVVHLPDRILDLLELAAYVFAADRSVQRGQRDAVDYDAWSRSFRFHVRVRDYDFWSQQEVQHSLASALAFATGDRSYDFNFSPGHATPPAHLFDASCFSLSLADPIAILPFSGGLDSLAGAVYCLEETTQTVCLVSHQAQPGTKRTQDALAAALGRLYPDRVEHYSFSCSLRGKRAAEESQRSRAFLFTSIAFALGQAYKQDRILVFENGVTSLNFARRQDAINGRTSRTTHPKTLSLFARLFSLFSNPLTIETPFLHWTKSQVVQYLVQTGHGQLIPSAVSCSKTYKPLSGATHCGQCFQCVDRRIAMQTVPGEFASLESYAVDIVSHSILDREARTTAVDYIRQAVNFAQWGLDEFAHKLINELVDIVDYLPGRPDEIQAIDALYELCRRHGEAVLLGLGKLQTTYGDLREPIAVDSLLHLIANREYLKLPVMRMVETISVMLAEYVPRLFSEHVPVDERDLNSRIAVLLESKREDIVSEHPSLAFASGTVIPDHIVSHINVFVEAKYIRGGTPPSKASEGIAADLTKFTEADHVLFVVYDPNHAIRNRRKYKADFEAHGGCTILII